MGKHPHLFFFSFSKTARNFPNIFQADTLEFHAYAEVFQCLEAERGVTGEILRWIPGYPPTCFTTPQKIAMFERWWCFAMFDWKFPFLEGISFWILILNFYVYHPISKWYPCASHFQPLEKVKASRWPTTIHQPPTALQKVIRDYSSEGKNVIPLIKDATKTTASTENPVTNIYNRKSISWRQKTDHHGWFMKNEMTTYPSAQDDGFLFSPQELRDFRKRVAEWVQ